MNQSTSLNGNMIVFSGELKLMGLLKHSLPASVALWQVDRVDRLRQCVEENLEGGILVLDATWIDCLPRDVQLELVEQIRNRRCETWLVATPEMAENLFALWSAHVTLLVWPLVTAQIHYQLERFAQQMHDASGESKLPLNAPEKRVKPATILLVDDYEPSLKALSQLLEQEYEVVAFTESPKALEWLKDHSADLILLDILMPVLSGYEFKKLLSRDARLKDIPVIFMSALDEANDESKGLGLGAVDYITKPFSMAVVMARVARQLEVRRLAEALISETLTDGLTGLLNRRGFEMKAQSLLQSAGRTDTQITVAMIDIDHFKAYNDHYGHPKGDVCLKQVANALAEVFHRDTDCVARWGGEEFVGLFFDTDHSGSQRVGRAIVKGVRELQLPHEGLSGDEIVTVSAGLVTQDAPKDTEALDVLLEMADKQLYRAKEEGRDRYASASVTESRIPVLKSAL